MLDAPTFEDTYERILEAMWPLVDYVDAKLQKETLLTDLTILHTRCLSPKKKTVCRAAKALVEHNGSWPNICRLAHDYYNDLDDFEDYQDLIGELRGHFTKVLTTLT